MIVIDDVTRKMHPLSEAFQVSKNVPKIDFSSTRFETRVFSAGSYPHLQTFRNSMLFRRPGDFANMLEIVAKKAKILHLYTPLDKPIFVASLDANRPYTVSFIFYFSFSSLTDSKTTHLNIYSLLDNRRRHVCDRTHATP